MIDDENNYRFEREWIFYRQIRTTIQFKEIDSIEFCFFRFLQKKNYKKKLLFFSYIFIFLKH